MNFYIGEYNKLINMLLVTIWSTRHLHIINSCINGKKELSDIYNINI